MLKTRLVNAVFIVAIITGLFVMFHYVIPRLPNFRPAPKIKSSPEILLQIQTLSELVTVKYVMEKVVTCDDPSVLSFLNLGMTQNQVLMVAHAIVKAGIDLKEIKDSDIQISKNKIILKLPPARVTDTYLDDKLTQVVDYKVGMLRSYNKDLEQNARAQAVSDITRAARKEGIERDAEERAKSQLTSFLKQLGFEQVEVVAPEMQPYK